MILHIKSYQPTKELVLEPMKKNKSSILNSIRIKKMDCIETVIFSPSILTIRFSSPFKKESNTYDLITGLEIFVDVKPQTPNTIKLGFENKILLEWELENLDHLSLLTDYIAEVAHLKIGSHVVIRNFEVMMYRHQYQKGKYIALFRVFNIYFTSEYLIIRNKKKNLLFQINWLTDSLEFFMNKKGIFTYYDELVNYQLSTIQTIAYRISFDENYEYYLAEWLFKIKNNPTYFPLFKLRSTDLNLKIVEYQELKFKKAQEEFMEYLQQTSKLKHIRFEVFKP